MPAGRDPDVVVREAAGDEELAVRRVLDAAILETDAVSDAVARGNVLVAATGRAGARGADGAVDDRVVGALVLVPFDGVALPEAIAAGVGMHVDAVAVRRRRRGRGVGRALVAGALERERRLTVAFAPRVRAFYDALDFDVVAGASDDGRLWGEKSL
ncbi:GNAT family N-acetyltransferase [Halorubellus sp. PRR65]|uniref:GNAT family N-acetyltransferase n=1 Tax=Halorubellus sp. PRR65 TaxID=3098148 RepID=UPI002B2617F6|nr:GNAT family N-acetyltransferase [Halorubellus sp. PRR65]